MSVLKSLDALSVAAIITDDPVTFGYGGTDYTGTTGARDTMKELTEGGFHHDQEFAILVPIAAFGNAAAPSEKDILTVCVDAYGIPCSADETTSARVNARVQKVGRAGGGLTLTLKAEGRG